MHGFVDASTLNIGKGGLGANMRTGGVAMPRKRYRPIMSKSPGFTQPNVGVAGAILGGAAAVVSTAARQGVQQRQQQTAQDRAEAMHQHPAQRSQSAVASAGGSRPIGSAAAASGSLRAPAAEPIYQAPTGMGATVPASRRAKFAQGRGM